MFFVDPASGGCSSGQRARCASKERCNNTMQFVVYVAVRNDPVDFYIRKDVLILTANSAEEAIDKVKSECLSIIKEQCSEGRGWAPGIMLDIVVKPLFFDFSMVADSDNLDSGSIGLFEVIDPSEL
jgi:hypothetical protein